MLSSQDDQADRLTVHLLMGTSAPSDLGELVQRSSHEVIVHGVIGGLLAGAVVAAWFLVVDLGTQGAFHTPTVLAGALLERDLGGPSFRIVLTYSILHFGVFVLFGVVTAWFLRLINAAPGFLLGVVFGLGVLDGVHYGTLLLTGAKVLAVLPAHHVLASNLLAGMTLMAYLHRAINAESSLGLGVLRGRPSLTQGLATGLVGAGTSAFWFFILDVIFARPFYTPAALGSAILLGAEGPAQVDVSLGLIAAYSVVHLAAFSVVGILVVCVAQCLERTPSLWLLVVMAFIVLDALFLGTVGLLSDWVMGVLGWWAVGIGNLVAVAAMGGLVWQRSPELRHRLLEEPVSTRV